MFAKQLFKLMLFDDVAMQNVFVGNVVNAPRHKGFAGSSKHIAAILKYLAKQIGTDKSTRTDNQDGSMQFLYLKFYFFLKCQNRLLMGVMKCREYRN